jgi:hypothetical protein
VFISLLPVHLTLFDFFHVNNIWCRVQIVIFLIIGIHHSVTACLLDEAPCFQYRNLCSSVRFWDHIWHAYKQICLDYSCEYFNSLPKVCSGKSFPYLSVITKLTLTNVSTRLSKPLDYREALEPLISLLLRLFPGPSGI